MLLNFLHLYNSVIVTREARVAYSDVDNKSVN